MAYIFHTYIYAPILSVLVFIYQNISFHDLGIAIAELTILVRFVLFPIFFKSAKDQALMQRIQPHIKEIQEKHKDNKEEQAKALMSLYKEHKLNPFSGFFLLLLQLPVLFAIYQIFERELSVGLFDNLTFLGLINLGEKSLVIAVLAALFQFVQTKLMMSKTKKGDGGSMASMNKIMVVVGPAISFFILMNLPSALGFFWIISTIFSIGQQLYINKQFNADPRLKQN